MMITAGLNSFGQLKQLTNVVADTLGFDLIKQYEPLDAGAAWAADINKLDFDEGSFRYLLNDDAMATENLESIIA